MCVSIHNSYTDYSFWGIHFGEDWLDSNTSTVETIAETFVYLPYADGNQNQTQGIVGYALDRDTGELTPVPGSPVRVDIDPSPDREQWLDPFALVVDSSGRFLYASVFGTPDPGQAAVFGFAIDQLDGSLTPLPGAPYPLLPPAIPACAGSQTVGLATHPTLPKLYVSVYAPGGVGVLTIDEKTGSLKADKPEITTTRAGAGQIAIDPKGRRLLVQVFENDTFRDCHSTRTPGVFDGLDLFAIDADGELSLGRPYGDAIQNGGQLLAIGVPPVGDHFYLPLSLFELQIHRFDSDGFGLAKSQASVPDVLFGAAHMAFHPYRPFAVFATDKQLVPTLYRRDRLRVLSTTIDSPRAVGLLFSPKGEFLISAHAGEIRSHWVDGTSARLVHAASVQGPDFPRHHGVVVNTGADRTSRPRRPPVFRQQRQAQR